MSLKDGKRGSQISEPAYLVTGNELYLFNPAMDSMEEMTSLILSKNWARVNLFQTALTDTVVAALAALVRGLYSRFGGDSYRICVYYPENRICEYLGLQEIPKKCYNFFINLWDELLLDEYKGKPEYFFRAADKTRHSYTLQLLLPGEFDITITDGAVETA